MKAWQLKVLLIKAPDCPPAQTESLPAESATERDIRLQKMSTNQCERLTAETTPERYAKFYSK